MYPVEIKFTKSAKNIEFRFILAGTKLLSFEDLEALTQRLMPQLQAGVPCFAEGSAVCCDRR